MKNSFVSLILLAAFALPAVSSAATVLPAGCSIPPDHAVWNANNDAVVSCIKGDVWDKAQAEAASRNNQNLPIIMPGVNLVDEKGVVYEKACPEIAFWGCVDLTRTEAYRQNMRGIARVLISWGLNEQTAPRFAGWIASVR